MLGAIAPFPATESSGRDAKVAAGKSGIVIMGFIVVKSSESLPGFP